MGFDSRNEGQQALDKHVEELINSEYKTLPGSFHENMGATALEGTVEIADPESDKTE